GLVPEPQQELVGDRKQRAFQGRKYRKFVVRPFDRVQRRSKRFYFFAAVKGLRPNQQMRNFARFEIANIIARDVYAAIGETPEQDADVTMRNGQKFFGALRIPNLPTALVQEPFDERHDRARKTSIDRGFRNSSAAVRTRRRECDDARL